MSYNSDYFIDKVVIVTGSASGIGEGTVTHFAKLGAKVVITDIDEQNMKRVAEKCESISPKKYRPLLIVTDLADDDQLPRIINRTIDHYGQLDVLVNNAAVQLDGPIEAKNSILNFDKTITVNLRAQFVLIKLA